MAQIPVVNGVRALPAAFTPDAQIGGDDPADDEYPELPQSVLDAENAAPTLSASAS